MARNQETLNFDATDGWVELTNGPTAKFCFQVMYGSAQIRVSAGVGAFGDTDDGLLFGVNTGQPATQSIFDVIPVAGADRVYARSVGSQKCKILVTHV